MNLPSKPEIKAKYGISDDDFEVLTSMPSEHEVAKRGGFLIRLLDAFGLKAWMWKSIAGVVVAIILIPPTVSGVVNFWKPVVEKPISMVATYWQSYSAGASESSISFVAFVPENISLPSHTEPLPIDQYPTGTGVFPISSEWIGPTGQWLG